MIMVLNFHSRTSISMAIWKKNGDEKLLYRWHFQTKMKIPQRHPPATGTNQKHFWGAAPVHPTPGVWFPTHLKIIIFATFRRRKIHHLRNSPSLVLDILTTEFTETLAGGCAIAYVWIKTITVPNKLVSFEKFHSATEKNRSKSENFAIQINPNLHAYYFISLSRGRNKLYESFRSFGKNLFPDTKCHSQIRNGTPTENRQPRLRREDSWRHSTSSIQVTGEDNRPWRGSFPIAATQKLPHRQQF